MLEFIADEPGGAEWNGFIRHFVLESCQTEAFDFLRERIKRNITVAVVPRDFMASRFQKADAILHIDQEKLGAGMFQVKAVYGM